MTSPGGGPKGIGRRSAVPPVALTAATLTVGTIVTVVVAFAPGLHFAYRSEATHLVLETFDGSIAALVALLLYGRYRRSLALTDLLLSYAMALHAIAAFGFVTVPLLAGADRLDTITTWAPLVIRLLGAGMVSLAATAPTGRLSKLTPAVDAVALVVLVSVIAVAAVAFPDALPVALDPKLSPAGLSGPQLDGHPGVIAAQAVNLAFYAVATVAFTHRATATRDEFTAWIGAAAGLNTTARLNYLLFPSLFSEYVYVGDFLRTGFYLMLLIGAVRELQHYFVTFASAAVLEERQRVARDLHDGLTQELTYIWGQLQQLQNHPERREVLPRLSSASARAIDEARRAIAALTRPIDEPLTTTLTQAAQEVAGRYGATVTTDIGEIEVDGERRESLIRIVREAVSNSARHAGTGAVCVRLAETGAGFVLVVSDEGAGFEINGADGQSPGYGLTTMRQRAEGTGGRFDLTSAPGGGTTVTVAWDG